MSNTVISAKTAEEFSEIQKTLNSFSEEVSSQFNTAGNSLFGLVLEIRKVPKNGNIYLPEGKLPISILNSDNNTTFIHYDGFTISVPSDFTSLKF